MLELRGLRVTYPGPPPYTAVEGVDLDVAAGAAVGLVGESGSGKSSIARAIVGLARVSGGSVRVDGREAAAARRRRLQELRRTVQLVFQDPRASLNPRMQVGATVQEAVAIAGERRDARDRRAEARRLLELVDLPAGAAERYPHELSGGQLQRVAIARALAVRPRLLLLDEVTASLDVSVQARILNLLRRLQRELELSALYISHDLSVIRYVSDHVYVMQRGRIVEDGPCEALFSAPRREYTRSLLAAVPTLGGDRWRRRPAGAPAPAASANPND